MLHLSPAVKTIIHQALDEDSASTDLTTHCLIPQGFPVIATLTAKTSGLLAGIDIALEVFRQLDKSLTVKSLLTDGSNFKPGNALGEICGNVISILGAERTALNLVQRLSGIATETSQYVAAIEGTGARIIDTRKTAPGLRILDKYAVRIGGGQNHRLHLGEGILIKNNHISLLRSQGFGLRDIITLAIKNAPHTLKIEIEVETIDDAEEALDTGVDIIMLDNMPVNKISQVVSLARGRATLEASGGINLETVTAIANTGVDLISIGALTHSVKASDINLRLDTLH